MAFLELKQKIQKAYTSIENWLDQKEQFIMQKIKFLHNRIIDNLAEGRTSRATKKNPKKIKNNTDPRKKIGRVERAADVAYDEARNTGSNTASMVDYNKIFTYYPSLIFIPLFSLLVVPNFIAGLFHVLFINEAIIAHWSVVLPFCTYFVLDRLVAMFVKTRFDKIQGWTIWESLSEFNSTSFWVEGLGVAAGLSIAIPLVGCDFGMVSAVKAAAAAIAAVIDHMQGRAYWLMKFAGLDTGDDTPAGFKPAFEGTGHRLGNKPGEHNESERQRLDRLARKNISVKIEQKPKAIIFKGMAVLACSMYVLDAATKAVKFQNK